MDKQMPLAPDYEKLVSLSEEFHCVLNFDGNLLMCNQVLLKALKLSNSALEDKSFESLLTIDSKKLLTDIWTEVLITNKKHSIKLTIIDANDSGIAVYWRIKADKESKLIYAVGNIVEDDKESEQVKLARALNFLDKDLATPQREGFPITDIQRLLTEKVDKYKLISQNVSDLVCLHDPVTLAYLYVSPSVTELTGYSPEDLVGKSSFDLCHPDFLERLDKDRRRSEKGEFHGPPPKMEAMFQTKDGGSKWVEAHSRPIFDDKGKVMLILSTSRDISERKQAELEKDKYFNYYKTLGNNIPNGAILLIDTNYKFIIAEGEVVENIDQSNDHYIGKTVSQVYDDTKLSFLKPYFEKVIKGEIVKFDYPHNEEYYSFQGTPGKDKEGNVVAGVCLIQNITETKQFQDLLKQTIFQLDFQKKALDVAALVSEADHDGVLTYVNDRFVETSQYSREELMGKPYTVMRSSYHSDSFYDTIWKQMSSGEVWSGEVKSETKGGDFIWLDTYIVPFKNPEGEIKKYVFIRFDITDRKAIQEKLEVKNFELDSFAYHTSHDLRAPLASILGLTGLIGVEDDISRVREMNGMIEKSVTKQDDFIKSILTYSQNKNLEPLIGQISFENILKGVKDELSNVPNADRVQVSTNISGDHLFYSDTIRVMIILKNLMSNSLKYCDPIKSKSKLNIGIQLREKGARIDFEDNGVGIRAQYLDKIFDMFYRGNETSDGSGLGLYIVKETIEKLKGSITISSEYGVGTKFEIEIPNLSK
jgi:PAS domain S-box-containing protein